MRDLSLTRDVSNHMLPINNKHSAIVALILASVIWGAASPIFKWSLETTGPFTLAFLRFALSTILLLPFVYHSLKIAREDIVEFLIMAFFGITLNIGMFFLGLEYTRSINAPLIGSSAPLFVVLISIFFLHQRVQVKTIAGSVVGLLGVLLIILQPILESGVDGSLVGNLLLMGAMFTGIIHLLVAHTIRKKYSAITITFYSFLFGSLTFLPLMGNEIVKDGFPALSGPFLIGVAYGAILASALAHYLYYAAMRYLQSSEVSLFAYIPPVIAILVAIPLLGESINALYVLGGILVFLGLYIAEAHIHYHPFHHKN